MSDDDISLRDYFAGQALAGIASRFNAEMIAGLSSGHRTGTRDAEAAYRLAAAMLEVRLRSALPVAEDAAEGEEEPHD